MNDRASCAALRDAGPRSPHTARCAIVIGTVHPIGGVLASGQHRVQLRVRRGRRPREGAVPARHDPTAVSSAPVPSARGPVRNAPVASGGPGCRGCCRDRVGRLQFAARRREFGDPGRTGGHRGHVGEGAVDAGTAEDSAGAKAPAPAAAPRNHRRRQHRSIRRLGRRASRRLRSKWRRGPTDHRGAHRPPAGHPHGGPRGPAFRAARPQRSRHR